MMFSLSEAADIDNCYFIAVPSVVGVALGTSMLLVWLAIRVLVERDPSISMAPTTGSAFSSATAAVEDCEANSLTLTTAVIDRSS